MRLLLSVPTDILLEEATEKVIAESPAGSFCLLPLHVDFATVLVPGLLTFTRPDGEEVAVAVDHGALVKVGDEVRVACQRAFVAGDAASAAAAVRERFEAESERDKRARAALARLESDVVRRLGELRRDHGA